MSTLYELKTEYLMLMQMIDDDPDGEDSEIVLDSWEAIDGEFEIKAENTAHVINELKTDAAKFELEIKRLQQKKKSLENYAERLKKKLEEVMITMDKPKFKTELYSFNIQNNPKSVKFTENLDVSNVPAAYFKDRTADDIRKSAVKEALENGEELEWAELIQTKGLRIR